MNTTSIIFSATTFFLSLTGAAFADAGTYDGSYLLDYQSLDLSIACNNTMSDLSVDLVDGRLPDGAFDVTIDAIYDQIETSSLKPISQKLAKDTVELFFAGIAEAVDYLLLSYPDLMELSSVIGSAEEYVFLAELADEDMDLNGESFNLTTKGIMDNGAFELANFAPQISLQDLEYASDYIAALSLSSGLAGNVSGDAGEGSLQWAFEAASTGAASGYKIQCRAKSSAAFTLSR